jgi:RimK family alpha-L-glutamate ligase
MHDKLRTAAVLLRADLPHPRTTHITLNGSSLPPPPVVLKPRFGSWGRDVRLCERPWDVSIAMAEFAGRGWFQRHGVIAQEYVPSSGIDLRLVVAGSRVVGAIERLAAPGEWRTNISLGGSRRQVEPADDACALAVAAAAAVGADLVGVDLLPLPGGGYTVIELNGAVDFDPDYSRPGRDIDLEAARALGILPTAAPRSPGAPRRPRSVNPLIHRTPARWMLSVR